MTVDKVSDSESLISKVPGDGGPSEVTDLQLAEFHEEIDLIVKSAAYGVTERRQASEDTRYCRWEGQSPDGRKHEEAHNGEPVFPYEGASDSRIREADDIVNERVLVMLAALMRAGPKCTGMKLDDDAFGGRIATLLKWQIRNHFGAKWLTEWTKLAQYREGDSPAGGVMGVFWQQEVALRTETIDREDLVSILVQQYHVDREGLGKLEAMLNDPGQDGQSADLLQVLLPMVKKKSRALGIVKDLRENGSAEFPMPYLRINGPAVAAYRLFEDIFFPANTTDFDRARCIFLREWLNKTEVEERCITHDYSEEFRDKLLEHEGQTGFPLIFNRPEGITGDFSGQLIRQSYNPEIYRGLYEVITVFFKATNEDGIPGIYALPFSKHTDCAAKDRELVDYAHGRYPFVFFGRESLTQRLWDSRGIPELVMTDQNSLKLLSDAANDNVSLATVPPILVPRRRGNLRIVIGPMRVIKEDRPGEIHWMEPPAAPMGNMQQQQAVKQRLNLYWGRIAEGVPPLLTQLHQEGFTRSFLTGATEVATMIVQLCQQYMDDDELALVTGDDNLPIGRDVKSIQGKFSLNIGFDVRDLDIQFVKTLAEILAELILPMDTQSTVQRDKLVQRLFTALEPSLAQETLRPVQTAQQDEIKDEQDNFAKIAAGVEPPMVAAGQNFQLRLQTLVGIGKANPEAFQRLAPMSRKILQARVQQLQNQVQQMANAQIGRQVGTPALQKAAMDQQGAGISGAAAAAAPQSQ